MQLAARCCPTHSTAVPVGLRENIGESGVIALDRQMIMQSSGGHFPTLGFTAEEKESKNGDVRGTDTWCSENDGEMWESWTKWQNLMFQIEPFSQLKY